MLRSNLLDISDFKVENLNVAGIAQLQTNVSGDKIYFGYDAKTGSDASGHWKLSIPSGNGGYASKIKKKILSNSKDSESRHYVKHDFIARQWRGYSIFK
jgi:hypothetical protein